MVNPRHRRYYDDPYDEEASYDDYYQARPPQQPRRYQEWDQPRYPQTVVTTQPQPAVVSQSQPTPAANQIVISKSLVNWVFGLVVIGITGGVFYSVLRPQTGPPSPGVQLRFDNMGAVIYGQQAGAKAKVVGTVGDVTVTAKGSDIVAPVAGTLNELQGVPQCYVFEPDTDQSYMIQFCGLNPTKSGRISEGESIGSGELISISLLKKLDQYGTVEKHDIAPDLLNGLLR